MTQARDEGVIKFECRWSNGPAPHASYLHELIAFRNRLFDLNLIGVYPDGIGFGNISARNAGSDKFIISASQTGHIARCYESHFVLVTNYDIEANHLDCIGPMKASSESLTHAMIYRIFPEAAAVIHVHNNVEWQRLQGLIPTSGVSVPYGTPEMAREVRRLAHQTDLPQKRIMVMAGHEDGILAFGSTLDEAFASLMGELRQNPSPAGSSQLE